jgi:hypothetical protein
VGAPTLLVRLPEAPQLKGATPLGERVAAGAWALQARKEVEQARWGVVHRLSSIVYGLWSNVRHASDAWSLGFYTACTPASTPLTACTHLKNARMCPSWCEHLLLLTPPPNLQV